MFSPTRVDRGGSHTVDFSVVVLADCAAAGVRPTAAAARRARAENSIAGSVDRACHVSIKQALLLLDRHEHLGESKDDAWPSLSCPQNRVALLGFMKRPIFIGLKTLQSAELI